MGVEHSWRNLPGSIEKGKVVFKNREEVENAARTFRSCGWAVRAHGVMNCLVGEAADGSGPVYGFSHNDMKVLVLGGQIASKKDV